ncbi:hypothetical protein [Sediminitomix flava]|uniref:Parallel beta helix pectate lyase-like protein n=1 Tax=Sediminitomix flava TaxID=379075 RepID=A0A315ZF96_SEDFL|nr:hypothetical protein [Sediminitomix flava]PWJ43829.1 hypothetical protein BC781_101175 [Sediminitomix flava]
MLKFNKFAIVAGLFASVAMTSCEEDETVLSGDEQFELDVVSALENVNFADASATGYAMPSWAKGFDWNGVAAEQGLTMESVTMTVSGDITEDTTWSGVVYLEAATFVKSGATLTIEPGTVIMSAKGNVYLMVETGAMIDAEGTADNMIVFSAFEAEPSTWGGLVLNGLAPINDGDASGSKGTEINAEIPYGGSNATDNSGVVSYVRVEYTGFAIDSESEHNGITLNGVGSGTTFENVQAFKGSDDGIEFFGGTVNLSGAVVTGCGDDQIDWAKGYIGTIDGAYIATDESSDKGMEIDNNSKNREAAPYSNATVKNVTLDGTAAGGQGTAIRFREGAKGTFMNIVAKGFKKGFDIHHNVTLQNLINGDVKLSTINFSESVASPFAYELDETE